ncbi:hypothetical protein KSS87_015464, partial [Heliosperma pusillum]
ILFLHGFISYDCSSLILHIPPVEIEVKRTSNLKFGGSISNAILIDFLLSFSY